MGGPSCFLKQFLRDVWNLSASLRARLAEDVLDGTLKVMSGNKVLSLRMSQSSIRCLIVVLF
jgi:hypothetical protein